MKILVVDDSDDYRETVVKILKNEGYQVDSVAEPLVGIEYFATNTYDLVISDYVMDMMDGVRFLQSIKKINPNIKTIMLTGKSNETRELESLSISINEYLVKEKSLEVILRYVKRVLELPTVTEPTHVKIESLVSKTEDIELNLNTLQVFKHGQEISLTQKEFLILKLLLENKNVALSREAILNDIWSQSIEGVDSRTVDSHVKNLRIKIKCFSISTIRSFGYRWNEK